MISSLMLGLALVAGAPEKKEAPKATIVGVWIGEKAVAGGKESPVPEGGITITFTDDGKVTVKEGEKNRDNATYTLDAKKTPAEIDITPPKGERKVLGIYKLDGDTLTLCFSKEKDATRPEKFESPEGSERMVMTLKRKK